MLNDDNFIDLLKKKDSGSQKELFKRFNSRILLYFRMRIKGDVPYEDLVQEVYASFFEGFNKGKITDYNNIAPYIFGIAKRVVFNYYYKKKKSDNIQKRVDDEFETISDFKGEENLENERLSEIINQKIEKLPEIDKKILRAFYLQEQSIGDIAELTGKTRHYISVRKERALKKIKSEIIKDKFVLI